MAGTSTLNDMAAAILRTLRMDVEATKSSSRDSSPNTVLRPESTWKEDAKSVATWFYNLVGPTLKGRPACKPTMPDVVPFIIEQLKDVMGPLNGKSDWTFCDLGCGQGMMLKPMSDATMDGKPMFEKVVGVELDPGTHREAVAAHNTEPRIEVVCGDMFPFIKEACNGKLFGGRAAFYVYEPLWMANFSTEEMDRLYGAMLAAIAMHPGSIIVYWYVRACSN